MIVSYSEGWPEQATNTLSLVPPLYAGEPAPQTPERKKPRTSEPYQSPYTRDRHGMAITSAATILWTIVE